jgi:HEXXH motif-containing protein
VVRQLRRAERSRRLLLLRALIEKVAESPELSGPLPAPQAAWELLAGTEQVAPEVLDLVLAHPYTGSWAGYVTRSLASAAEPVWPHIGYVHALAAAAAIRAGISFRTSIPVWRGTAVLPTLGAVRVTGGERWSVAEIQGEQGIIEVRHGSGAVRLPADLTTETPSWLTIRRITAHGFSVQLDDLDPYRDPHDPAPPERLTDAEAATWQELLEDAFQLIAKHIPDFADAIRAGLDSLAPLPFQRFRTPSASSSDAFGSAILGRPPDAPVLAAMLIHEFQHNRLSGLLHLTRMWTDDGQRRFYAPWRDDPRPIGGLIQGLYAFFGVTAFWRALTESGDTASEFEFAYHRTVTWQALKAVEQDAALTNTGRRFLAGIASVLGPWQGEPVGADAGRAARLTADDHYLGWRIRHLRPRPAIVEGLVSAWLTGADPIRVDPADQAPDPEPDGTWSYARADLMRAGPEAVPEATAADIALVNGHLHEAAHGYRAELAHDPDQPVSLAGLALTLSPDSALRRRPEVVRAVHRRLRQSTTTVPSVEQLADWIG